jgi:hypothetical protein
MLDADPQLIDKKIKSGELKSYRFAGSRKVLLRVDELLALVAEEGGVR